MDGCWCSRQTTDIAADRIVRLREQELHAKFADCAQLVLSAGQDPTGAGAAGAIDTARRRAPAREDAGLMSVGRRRRFDVPGRDRRLPNFKVARVHP